MSAPIEIPLLIKMTGSWMTLTSALWAISDRADTVLSEEARRALTSWLRRLPAGKPTNWPAAVARIFDRVFSESYFSWSCFARCSVASLVVVTAIALLNLQPLLGPFLPLHILLIAVVLNFVPNYISYLETRLVLHWMSRNPTSWRIAKGLVLDFLLTTGIAFALQALAWKGLTLLTGPTDVHSSGFTSAVTLEAVFISSTYFSSVWVWLYAFAGGALVVAVRFNLLARHLNRLLDVDNKPVRSLGFVAMLVVTICYLTAGTWIALS